jgi:hypothetical protein
MGLSRVAQWQDRCSKITSAPVTSEVVDSIPGQTHSSCDREGDSLWQRRFLPGSPVSSYIHYKSPNIVYRANNVLVDAQLSIQYFIHTYIENGKHRIYVRIPIYRSDIGMKIVPRFKITFDEKKLGAKICSLNFLCEKKYRSYVYHFLHRSNIGFLYRFYIIYGTYIGTNCLCI